LFISFKLTTANPPSLAPDSPVAPISPVLRLLTTPSALTLFFFDLTDLIGDSLPFFSDFAGFSDFSVISGFSDYSGFSYYSGFSDLAADSFGCFLDLDLELFTDFT
jgi:hypothetical protein